MVQNESFLTENSEDTTKKKKYTYIMYQCVQAKWGLRLAKLK